MGNGKQSGFAKEHVKRKLMDSEFNSGSQFPDEKRLRNSPVHTPFLKFLQNLHMEHLYDTLRRGGYSSVGHLVRADGVHELIQDLSLGRGQARMLIDAAMSLPSSGATKLEVNNTTST